MPIRLRNLPLKHVYQSDWTANLSQIHSGERVDGHRELSQQAVHFARHAAAFAAEDDDLIGFG